jgi:hypothetical protein
MSRPTSLERLASEASEQMTVIKWADLAANMVPELRLLFHIPNGGAREEREAAKLKAAGVRAGVPDLCLPVARGGRHGLYIELKTKTGRVAPEQAAWLQALDAQGYAVFICYGAGEAIAALARYLGMKGFY